ncbi:transcription factor MAMYB [Lotus japonicus]|uniref:transcription factor MAMYB n=1 Tax=Lotus japonicus TaxID=34305 RepID=UPI00258D7DF5|nr:transcription factor MAMYB [Lotus japonicus]
MEFLDEDARPRFLFQSGAAAAAAEPQPHLHKPTKLVLFITITLSSILFALALFFFQSEPFKSILFWLSLSLLIGPFAPISLTGGDVSVGRGNIVNFPDEHAAAEEDQKPPPQRRSRSRRSDEPAFAPVPTLAKSEHRRGEQNGVAAVAVAEEEKGWNEEDVEILKKQMAKHPVGKPGRWEAIAAAFGGRHKAESVIKKSKELGEKRSDDSDSYEQFLKKRKAADKRGGGEEEEGKVEEETNWSNGEDIALLNALKAFPKDAPMRWEKVAVAVPGKSKAACVKRVAELKKGFRSSKGAS